MVGVDWGAGCRQQARFKQVECSDKQWLPVHFSSQAGRLRLATARLVQLDAVATLQTVASSNVH